MGESDDLLRIQAKPDPLAPVIRLLDRLKKDKHISEDAYDQAADEIRRLYRDAEARARKTSSRGDVNDIGELLPRVLMYGKTYDKAISPVICDMIVAFGDAIRPLQQAGVLQR
jgi:hypothetical protein